MASKIDFGDLRATINDILNDYGAEAAVAVEESAKETARQVVKDLKKGGSYNGGEDFNKGWTSKTEKTRLGTGTIIYNKTKPGLAHLLEFGHAKQNGGRTKAFNFIGPVADTVESRFLEAFENAMR